MFVNTRISSHLHLMYSTPPHVNKRLFFFKFLVPAYLNHSWSIYAYALQIARTFPSPAENRNQFCFFGNRCSSEPVTSQFCPLHAFLQPIVYRRRSLYERTLYSRRTALLRKRLTPVKDSFSVSRGCPLTGSSTVFY